MNYSAPGVTVVLDDDPTGIQTVHGIKLYTMQGMDLFKDAFIRGGTFYVWTNTRSLNETEMLSRNSQIMDEIIKASEITGKDFTVISRSDSTLRGHYPKEPLLIREKYEETGRGTFDGEVLFFYFAEGGRYTINDIHYVKTGAALIPAAETEFARDKNFGYAHSDLKEYIEEKTGGMVKTEDVVSISIDMIRDGDVLSLLKDISGYRRIVVNALNDTDAEIAANAFKAAERTGKRFIYRTAASFVRAYAGIEKRSYLDREDLGAPEKILIIVGSYVEKTTRQLECLLKNEDTSLIEIDINMIISSSEKNAALVKNITEKIEDRFKKGLTPVLATSRNKPEGLDNEGFLEAGARISSFMTDVAAKVSSSADVIVTKGGITSNDIVEKAMGVKSATVLGQIIGGVPVILPDEHRGTICVPVVIFPGNVGEESDLDKVYKILRRR